MEKLKSSLTNMVAVLTVIAIVAGAVLAYVNDVTKPKIEQIQKKNLADGIKEVLGSESAPTVQSQDTIKDKKGTVTAIVYKTDKGVAVQSTDPNGFGGPLTVLVGFDDKDNIKGYKILDSQETAGLGAKAKDWFQKKGKGSIIDKNPGADENGLQVSKDNPENKAGAVDAITASTITSRAFLRAVNAAYKAKKGNADGNTGATKQAEAKPDCCKEGAECCEGDTAQCCEKE